jgi:hypothetical protein
MTAIRKTDGKWSKDEMGLYFLALWDTDMPSKLATMPYQKGISALIEYNLLAREDDAVEAALDLTKIYRHLFIDSGVFSLANAEAKRKNVSFEEGLRLKLSDIDTGEEYLAAYMAMCHQIKDYVWGYVEVDLGGRDEKIKMRDRFHAAGLSPIPVYHPLLDGTDYLEYLCDRYDRICVSNLVQSNSETRSILTAYVYNFIQQRPKKKRPYVHYLGVSPGQAHFAHNCLGSCDSSSWAMGRRFGTEQTMAFSQLISFTSPEGENKYAPVVGGKGGYHNSQRFQMSNWGMHGYENYYEEVHRSHMAI